MQFVELVISDEQALMTRLALDIILNDPERYVLSDEERQQYERLAVFFGTAAADPSRFPLSGRQAKTIKSIVRKAKGPAQPQSRRNRRKVRQAQRQSFHKRRRQELREFKDEYNEAMKKLAAEAEEAQRAAEEMQAKYEAEPKFAVYDGVGNLIMAGIPESAIRPMGEELPGVAGNGPEGAATDGLRDPSRRIILPGTAEALGLE